MIRTFASRHYMEFALAMLVGIATGLIAFLLGLEGLSSRWALVAIGLLASLVVVLVYGDLRKLLVAAIIIDMSSALDVHITCDETFPNSSCGIGISVTLLALILLYGLWIYDLRRHAEKLPRPRLGLIGSIAACYIAVGILSILAAPLPEYSLYRLWVFVVLLALFFYLANNIQSQEGVLFIVALVALGLLIQSALMQFQSLGIIEYHRLNRISGTFKSPNYAGAYLMQITLLLLAGLALRITGWQKSLLALIILLGLVNLIGTQSRGSWIGFVVGMAVFVIGAVLKKWLNLRIFVAVLLMATMLSVLFSNQIITRLTTDDRGAAQSRGPLAQIALQMVSANPVIGVGLNNFGVVLRDYIEADQMGAWLSTVHNAWLLVWSETGTLGLFFYVAFWLVTIWYAFRLVVRGHPVYGVLALGIIASMIGASVHMMVEIFGLRTLIQIIWTNAALVVAMTRLQNQHDAAASQQLAESYSHPASRPLKSGWKAT